MINNPQLKAFHWKASNSNERNKKQIRNKLKGKSTSNNANHRKNVCIYIETITILPSYKVISKIAERKQKNIFRHDKRKT